MPRGADRKEEGEPTFSPVAGRRPMSGRMKALVGVLGVTSAAGVFWLLSQGMQAGDGAENGGRPLNAERVGEVGERWSPIPREAPPPPPPVLQPAMVVPPPRPPSTMGAPGAFTPFAQRAAPSRVGIVAFELPGGGGPPTPGGGPSGAPEVTPGMPATLTAGRRDALADRLQAGDDMDTAVATVLPDRNLFITMGTPMACTPEQPINTDQPGPFRCKVSAPVYSTSGAVPLLDAGTWFVGQVRESLQRGRRRAFAVMTRIETPQGCLIRLRAPVADQLGEAGLDGEVDNHFWERFRGLAAVAFLDAASQAAATAAANALASRNGNSVSFNSFGGVGGRAGSGFADEADISPTLRRNQARPILVMAMQDLDMRPCFQLRMREVRR
ncbi:TrbI/VirB10 family protein [Muricoccus pecuniae]|uniref:Type IV secretion system protein VirB10 n=1 Tax=Muricoccus pecuniae TaxID=693023 RepID=A0A840YHY7_9PROT|nr:TrbI/VirB10 family protein [Roseomonas pecuniae]MBB5696051.1 type IV secretion system protein VirB10 [Roseomonas pecuniae]